MTIVESDLFKDELRDIVFRIHQDKPSASVRFVKRLRDRIRSLTDFPLQCRRSHYFDDDTIRDLIFKGYTIIYKIDSNTITLISIFNQNLPVIKQS